MRYTPASIMNPDLIIGLRILLIFLSSPFLQSLNTSAGEPRNVILILTDDLGYGDVGCYGAEKVKTPNMDSLAANGLRFTDAHSPSSMCTPTRYGVLTGRYAWRTWLKSGVFQEQDPLLIENGRTTIADFFKSKGFNTACIGKWHLGFGTTESSKDWNKALKPGPVERGFDTFFGIPVNPNVPPQVLMRDHHVVGLDPEDPIKILRPQKAAFTWLMEGGLEARLIHDQLSEVITSEAELFIEKNKQKRFFLYLPTHQVHHPVHPAPKHQRTSQAGPYGDYIQDLDHTIGRVINKLKEQNLFDNTLLIVTSDNGSYLGEQTRLVYGATGYLPKCTEAYDHYPNGSWRGWKTQLFEGGHRVPLIVSWPDGIKTPQVVDGLFSLTDLFRTIAGIFNTPLKQNIAPDSIDFSKALLSNNHKKLRESMIYHSGAGQYGFREGPWVYFDSEFFQRDGKVLKQVPKALYNLHSDPKQIKNVVEEHSELADQLKDKLTIERNLSY